MSQRLLCQFSLTMLFVSSFLLSMDNHKPDNSSNTEENEHSIVLKSPLSMPQFAHDNR